MDDVQGMNERQRLQCLASHPLQAWNGEEWLLSHVGQVALELVQVVFQQLRTHAQAHSRHRVAVDARQ